ncbi:MAG: DUF3817 domain-containing protein [Micromonosporaceae bacterium]
MSAALKRYQVIAYVVGVLLVALMCVAMPLKYFADQPAMVAIVGPFHGFMYMIYLALSADLARRVKWPITRTIVVLLAGTIPFLSFVAERSVTREVRGLETARGPGAPGSSTD